MAAGQAAPDVNIEQVLQYGLLGIIFFCVIIRKFIVPEWTLKKAEEKAEAEKAELTERLAETREQLNKLQGVFQDQMIPALTRATEINAKYTDELQRARYANRRQLRQLPPVDEEPGRDE